MNLSLTQALLSSVAIAAAFAAPGAAEAQTRTLGGSVDVVIEYDPRASGGNDTVAAIRKLEQDDVNYTVRGGLDLSQPIAGFSTGLSGGASYFGHVNNSKLDRRNIDLRTRISRRIASCDVSATGGGSRSDSLLEQLDLTYRRNVQNGFTAAGNIACNPIAGLQGGAGVNYLRSTNSAVQGVDSKSQAVSANVGYGNPLLGSLQLVGSYSRFSYDGNRPSIVGPAPTGAESWNTSAQYTRPLGRNLQGSVSVGSATTKPRGGMGGENHDLTASAQLAYQLRGLIGSFTYSRNVAATNLVGASYSYNQSLAAQVSYDFLGRISAGLSGELSKNHYRGEVFTSPTSTTAEVLNLGGGVRKSVSATFRYRLSPRLSTNLLLTQGVYKYSGLLPVASSPLSQLGKDTNRSVGGGVDLILPFDTTLNLQVTYDQRRANLTAFDYNTIRSALRLTKTF